MISDVDILLAKLHTSTLSFTKYFYYEKTKRKFVVNKHHELICNALDRVIRGEVTRLIINLPPRYSKTEIVVKNFIAKGLSINPASKFIHLSYSDDLACDNSEEIRELVKSEAYQELYPYVQIKQGSDSKKKWYTTDGGGVYATSAGGQVTGFGAGAVDDEEELAKQIDGIKSSTKFAGAVIIDDPIKPDDANSEAAREKVNTKFETTIRNRVNSRNTTIIIIMQRLHEHDLCGYLQKIEPDTWEVLSLPAITYEEGEPKALWPFKHTLEELYAIKNANSNVFETQYMQNPTPLEGLMYGEFKTYDTLPITKTKIRKNYTDTADTGADFLCSIDYVETEVGNFILDVLYTDKAMEYTEPMVAAMLHKDGINVSNIESNNGGRGFARNVESQTRLLGNNKTKIEWFHQSANKAARIFSRSNEVTNLTYFPSDWEKRWPAFARQIKGYRKDGKEAHDDACFVGETLISTIKGDVRIDEIKEGDLVITPFGCRRVIASMCTGVKPTMRRFRIEATGNHKIYYGGDFLSFTECHDKNKLSRLTLKELIKWKYRRLLCLMESNTNLWGREGIISANQIPIAGGKVLKDFMLRFGNFITGEKFLKVFIFTIKMATLLTMTFLTWNVLKLSNICLNIRKKGLKMSNIRKPCVRFLKKTLRRRQNGIVAKKGKNGIQNIQEGNGSKINYVYVRNAVKSFSQRIKTLFFAVTNAEIDTDERNLDIQQSALNVEKNSNTGLQMQERGKENSALCLAGQPTLISIKKVYNIKVEKEGCYYANGILVSNCDALTGTIEMRGKHENQMNYYNGQQEGKRVVFVMPDNAGKFIMLSVVVNEYINVDKVVYTQGFDHETMLANIGNADDVVFECDKAFFSMARELRRSYDVRIMHKNTNPLLRMSAQKAFISEYVRYRDDYDEFPQYTAFMDAVLDESNSFEAMDAISAMSVYVQKKYMGIGEIEQNV